MKFSEIPKFPFAAYRCHIGWDYLENWLDKRNHEWYSLELNPDYQRGYVWSKAQKSAYVEYRLRGGFSGGDLFWNCPNWMGNIPKGAKLEIVDGKQRLDAVLGFLNNKVKAFGLKYSEFEGKLSVETNFYFHINNLVNKRDILQWYLGMNTGGSVHTKKDLAPAYRLLDQLSQSESESESE